MSSLFKSTCASLALVARRRPRLAAWLAIVLAAAVKATAGLPGLYALVKASRLRQGHDRGHDHARIFESIKTAAVMLPFATHCLVRSVATVILLRATGLAAELVIGCRQLPFAAHAWVEVSGAPVSEERDPRQLYLEIDRV
jgi:hypothetical protein